MPSSIANAITDLRTKIIAAVASEGNVGSRVFYETGIGDKITFPYIVIVKESVTDDQYREHGGINNAEQMDFSTHIHSTAPEQAIALRDLLVNGLAPFSGVEGNTTFGHILKEGEASFFNEKTKTATEVIDFTAMLTNN